MKRSLNQQSGVALLFALLALFLLTAIALGMIYMTNTEGSVNANYRNDQALYFAAKAGLEEARNRLMPTNPNSLVPPNCTGGPSACLATTPVVPGPGNNGIMYIINGGTNPGAVQPWSSPTVQFGDNELCHDGYTALGISPQSSDVPCQGSLPAGNGWYATTASLLPFNGTAAALPFQWVRIAMKVNNSVQSYPVNGAFAGGTPVCFDGAEEILLQGPATDCTKMVTANTPPGPAANPVFLITSLAASPVTGARRMVQAEVAVSPAPPFPYGMFATSNGCGAVTLGGGATTNSFTSANGGNYSTTASSTGGDVGSNGNVSALGNAQIGGMVGVPAVAPAAMATQGPCPGNNFTTNGGAGFVTLNPPVHPNPNTLTTIQPYTFTPPPPPNPAPPTTAYNVQKAGATILPGSYGNISVNAGGTLVLTAGTYNINTLTVNGNAQIVTTGPVVINVMGAGSATPVTINGGGLANTSGIANNFQINYSGTGTVQLGGGAQTYMIVNAPAANVKLKGGTDFYGAIIAATIDDSGGVNFHFDKNSKLGPPNPGNLTEISFRDVMY